MVPSSRFSPTISSADNETLVSCRLDRSAARCYQLFRDVESIPRWLGIVTSVEVQTRDGRNRPQRVTFSARLEQDSVSYTLDYGYDDESHQVSWRSVDSDLSVTGSAVFEAVDEDSCLMHYRLRSVLPDRLPGWADTLYSERPADSVVVEFCEWVCRKTP